MRKRTKFALFIPLVILILFGLYIWQKTISLEDMRNYVSSFGKLVPLIILIMIIISSSIGFIFQIPVALAGILLDFRIALAISVIGLAIGAAISFSLSRLLGRDYIENKYINKIKRLRDYDNHLTNHGFLAVLIFRIITIIPYELINIAGGVSKMRFSSFFFATIIGIIPGTLVALYFAHSISNIFSTRFIFATAINLAFSIVPLCFRRVRKLIFYAE